MPETTIWTTKELNPEQWQEICESMEKQYPAIADFMKTWGSHCGAPRSVLLGHVCVMAREVLAQQGKD